MENKWRKIFGERGQDRRQGYSLRQHFGRVRREKGWLKLSFPLVGTAVIAAALFANCSSDGITGPASSTAASVGSGTTQPGTNTTSDGYIIGVSQTFPVQGTEPNPCYPPDMVPYTGTATFSDFVDQNDVFRHRIEWKYKFDGPGTVSHVEYHGNEKYLEQVVVKPLVGADEKYYHRIRMIPEKAEIPAYFFIMIAHIRLNAAGEPVVAFTHQAAECRDGAEVDPTVKYP